MSNEIQGLVQAFESGRLTRRELVSHLSALVAVAAAAGSSSAQPAEPLFQATGLNHIALRVPDLARSRDFYRKMLGMSVASDSAGSCFLTFGNAFLALFRGDQAGMDHYCYSVNGYNQQVAADKLRSAGLEPRLTADRIYFKDPDGLTVQLADSGHRP